MPLARFEIEELRPGHWVGFVEAGAVHVRRRNLHAGSFAEIVRQVENTYHELNPPPKPAEAEPARDASAEPETEEATDDLPRRRGRPPKSA